MSVSASLFQSSLSPALPLAQMPKYTRVNAVNVSGKAVSQALSQAHPAKHNREQVQELPKIPGHTCSRTFPGTTNADFGSDSRSVVGAKSLCGEEWLQSVFVCVGEVCSNSSSVWQKCIAGYMWAAALTVHSLFFHAVMIIGPWRLSAQWSTSIISSNQIWFSLLEDVLFLRGVFFPLLWVYFFCHLHFLSNRKCFGQEVC